MWKEEYQLLNIVLSLDGAETVVKAHQVSKCRTFHLSDCTKYS